MDALTPRQILDDPRPLYLNSPIEYPYAEKIEKAELARLKSFLIQIFCGPEDKPGGLGDQIRQGSHEEVIGTFLDNHFTFDPEWYGVRELPKGIDGKPISALDDPARRRKLGFTS